MEEEKVKSSGESPSPPIAAVLLDAFVGTSCLPLPQNRNQPALPRFASHPAPLSSSLLPHWPLSGQGLERESLPCEAKGMAAGERHHRSSERCEKETHPRLGAGAPLWAALVTLPGARCRSKEGRGQRLLPRLGNPGAKRGTEWIAVAVLLSVHWLCAPPQPQPPVPLEEDAAAWVGGVGPALWFPLMWETGSCRVAAARPGSGYRNRFYFYLFTGWHPRWHTSNYKCFIKGFYLVVCFRIFFLICLHQESLKSCMPAEKTHRPSIRHKKNLQCK